jgi:hypothetical protein
VGQFGRGGESGLNDTVIDPSHVRLDWPDPRCTGDASQSGPGSRSDHRPILKRFCYRPYMGIDGIGFVTILLPLDLIPNDLALTRRWKVQRFSNVIFVDPDCASSPL